MRDAMDVTHRLHLETDALYFSLLYGISPIPTTDDPLMKRNALDATDTDTLTRFTRRGLWLALLLILLLGGYAVLANAFPQSTASHYAGRLMSLLGIAIIVAVVWLASSRRGQRISATNPAMRAVMDDEWRHASMHKACRMGFFGMLSCQPLLGIAFLWIPLTAAPQIMATVTIVVGVSVFLATFLFCDRQP